MSYICRLCYPKNEVVMSLHGWKSGGSNHNNSCGSSSNPGRPREMTREAVLYHLHEATHVAKVQQLYKERSMAQVLVQRWNDVRTATSAPKKTRSALVAAQEKVNPSDLLLHRVESLGLPAWRNHVKALLLDYMMQADSKSANGSDSNNTVKRINSNRFPQAEPDRGRAQRTDRPWNGDSSSPTNRSSPTNSNVAAPEQPISASLAQAAEAYSAISEYEQLERLSLLELAVWKSACLVSMPPCRNGATIDYLALLQWSKTGWKEHKQIVRQNTNAIAIALTHVVPFIHDPNQTYQYGSGSKGFVFGNTARQRKAKHQSS